MSSQAYEALELQKNEQVKELLESRHIMDEEIKMVIYHGETIGEKLYQPETGSYLAKMRIVNTTFYVEYSITGEKTYEVHTAYFHKAELED